jgi:hypothetical protein
LVKIAEITDKLTDDLYKVIPMVLLNVCGYMVPIPTVLVAVTISSRWYMVKKNLRKKWI